MWDKERGGGGEESTGIKVPLAPCAPQIESERGERGSLSFEGTLKGPFCEGKRSEETFIAI